MNKILKIGISVILISTIALIINKYRNVNIINKEQGRIECNIKYKGLQGAIDFVVDEEYNYYIAYNNSVEVISKSGKSYTLFKDNSLSIKSIEYYGNNLYFLSKSNVFCFNIKTKEQRLLVNNIPNFGDYSDGVLKAMNGNLYISIGAATNSGIVGNDNEWLKENPYFHDISPIEIILKGKNFSEEKTGAFVPYKTNNNKEQIVAAHFPGNSSLIIYHLSTSKVETYASGIRNVKAMDFTSENKLIGIVGGMENRGLRPIKGDTDYIYEIIKNAWYGWPDYSGGDPINSPKFKGKNNERVEFILEKHPTNSPPAPIYQHKSLNTLSAMAVDKNGVLGKKDSIYFYDNKDNSIYELDKGNILINRFKLGKFSSLGKIMFTNNELVILERKTGSIYTFRNIESK
jgi:hypothetical protein